MELQRETNSRVVCGKGSVSLEVASDANVGGNNNYSAAVVVLVVVVTFNLLFMNFISAHNRL